MQQVNNSGKVTRPSLSKCLTTGQYAHELERYAEYCERERDREHELRLRAEQERDELLEKARATLDAYRKEYGE